MFLVNNIEALQEICAVLTSIIIHEILAKTYLETLPLFTRQYSSPCILRPPIGPEKK